MEKIKIYNLPQSDDYYLNDKNIKSENEHKLKHYYTCSKNKNSRIKFSVEAYVDFLKKSYNNPYN